MPDTETSPADQPRAWRYSTMETFYPRDIPSVSEPCEVIITGRSVAISHQDAELGLITLRGDEVEPGHFTVRGPNGSTFTLHRFHDDARLEGVWTDRGNTGMWTITLSDDPEDAR